MATNPAALLRVVSSPFATINQNTERTWIVQRRISITSSCRLERRHQPRHPRTERCRWGGVELPARMGCPLLVFGVRCERTQGRVPGEAIMKRRAFCASTLALTATALASRRLPAATSADIPAAGRAGGQVVLRGGDIADLRAALRGRLLSASENGYDEARRIWNGMFDRRPALIARCAGAADVTQAVDFARENDLLIAVRGGGHSLSGQSVCDGGLMIDLSPMRGIRVDPIARTARVEGGVLLGDLDRESQAFGLAMPAGRISHTGAAGLTLGGGFGRLTRRYGLACDNLRAADVITADGRYVRVGAQESQELLWGLKGGGGNFGVVTSFEYQLHPAGPMMYGGAIAWPMREARKLLGFYAGFIEAMPDELFIDAVLTTLPQLGQVVLFSVCYSGAPDRAPDALKPLRQFGTPVLDALRPAPYVVLQSENDGGSPHGRGNYERSGFLTRISPALVDIAISRMEAPRPPGTRIILTGECGGVFGRVAPAATAFQNRDARSTIIVQAQWDSPHDQAAADAHQQWARDTFDLIAPHTKGFYVNTVAVDDPAQRIRATYGGNYDRLVALKRKYDPSNLFRRNANIPPG
jgi:FAD/FMN-containing dehydrogenase